jgi:N-acetylneuraminic acid mutarotase
MRGKYRNNYPGHYAIIYVNETNSWFILGGNGNRDTNLEYTERQIRLRNGMPHEKTFFPAVYSRGIIYTFGGYDVFEKSQLASCEYYDIKADKWYNSHAPTFKLS